MGQRINKLNKTQEDRILDTLREKKDFVNGQYFLRTMLISQYHRAIHNLEKRGVVIEHSAFKDEFGFLSYRLVSEPGGSPVVDELPQSTAPRSSNGFEKINFDSRPAPPRLNEWVFESKSQPGKKYHVVDFTTFLSCDCIAFTYRKTCNHVEEVKRMQKQSRPVRQQVQGQLI